ncbi:hypothetical protein PT169_05895 [Erysipelothrix rhusiopathiae]|nr:hypothetical protein [Erysipelothrix rhusiopathiae]
MRKLGSIFTILTALLLFSITFTQFDRGYKASQSTLFKQEQLNQSIQTVQMSLSMERFQGNQASFLEELIAFFQNHDYEAMVSIQKGYTHYFYVYTDQSQAWDHLKLSRSIDNLNFKSQEEYRFISNSTLQNDAYAYVLPFNRNDKPPKSDSYNPEINYYPLHFLNKTENKTENLIVGLEVFVQPESITQFKTELYNEFLLPHFSCSDVSDNYYCGMLITDANTGVQVLDQLMELNAFTNPLEFPNSLLMLTIGTLFTILMMTNMEQNREITIRHLHGNRATLIFKRIFMKPVMASMGLFMGTLIGLSLYSMGFLNAVSLRYLRNLGVLTAIYIGFVIITTILFFLFQLVTVKSIFLKKRTKSKIMQIVIPSFKIVAVVILLMPLGGIYDGYQNIRHYQNVVSSKPELQSGSMISSLNYGYDTTSVETDMFNVKVFELVERYGLSYINSEAMMDRHDDLRYIITNRNALMNESIMTRDGQKLDVRRFEVNTLLVPEGSDDTAIPHFEVDTIPVRKTPTVATVTYINTPKSIRENVPILIVVKPNSMFLEWIGSGSVFASKSNQASFDSVVEAISKWSDIPEITKLEDAYETTMIMYKQQQFKFYTMFGATVSLIILFSMLIFEMFIDLKGMEVSVQYLQGKHRFERYGKLVIWNMMSVVLGCGFIVIHRARTASEVNPGISLRSLSVLSLIVIFTDLIWMIYQIRKFEKDHMLYFLKGDLG